MRSNPFVSSIAWLILRRTIVRPEKNSRSSAIQQTNTIRTISSYSGPAMGFVKLCETRVSTVRRMIHSRHISLPEESRFRQIHEGHAIYHMPEERRFITPEAISTSCMVGSPEDIIDQILELEKTGIKEVNIMPAADHARDAFKDFADKITPVSR